MTRWMHTQKSTRWGEYPAPSTKQKLDVFQAMVSLKKKKKESKAGELHVETTCNPETSRRAVMQESTTAPEKWFAWDGSSWICSQHVLFHCHSRTSLWRLLVMLTDPRSAAVIRMFQKLLRKPKKRHAYLEPYLLNNNLPSYFNLSLLLGFLANCRHY